ncbi:MAG: ASCH domain-containing protein [Eubacteriales bacterium]
MVYRMNLHPSPFEFIKSGKKSVEMRLNDERRKYIKVSDTIIFSHTETGEEFCVTVTEIKVYKDFYELYKHYDKTEIGYLPEENADPADMYEYYPPEKIEKYGALAIRIKPAQ